MTNDEGMTSFRMIKNTNQVFALISSFDIRASSFTAAEPPLDLHHFGFFALEVIVDRFYETVSQLLDIDLDVVQTIFG
jgi:hypothetical protein